MDTLKLSQNERTSNAEVLAYSYYRRALKRYADRHAMPAILDLETAPTTNEEAAERSFELYWLAAQLLRVEEHDRALMAPKLVAKERAIAGQSCPNSIFEAKAVAAQIGWLETSLPAAAAQALHAVEDLLSSGHSEASGGDLSSVEDV